MCGIHICVFGTGLLGEKCCDLLENRGPDSISSRSGSLQPCFRYEACCSVLWMRGVACFQQPVITAEGNVFLWNGNVFGGLDVPSGMSDTQYLAEALSSCSVDSTPCALLSLIEGPYSFVFWHQSSQCLWFGRDPLGRRSLLWNSTTYSDENSLVLSSVWKKGCGSMMEVPNTGVFRMDLSNDCTSLATIDVHLYPWSYFASAKSDYVAMRSIHPAVVLDVNRACPDQPALAMYQPGMSLEQLSVVPALREAVDRFEGLMLESVKRRVTNMPALCRHCVRSSFAGDSGSCQHARLAILFSGGVDSALVATLAHRCYPVDQPIDLLNVAFVSNNCSEDTVPDRVSGLNCLRELQRLCPERTWNFVKVDVTAEEMLKWRDERVCHLIYPQDSVLDDSIGCALWFAARGVGVLSESREPYTSPARVVLVGMGADEQLGGYGRHRMAFEDRSWPGLIDEMQKQLVEISQRNLGRDDRVISDHGREARFPFLDEGVVSFLSTAPVWLKARLEGTNKHCLSCSDKLPIRLLTLRYGLVGPAKLIKKAIQFGSRIAKLNRNISASDRSSS